MNYTLGRFLSILFALSIHLVCTTNLFSQFIYTDSAGVMLEDVAKTFSEKNIIATALIQEGEVHFFDHTSKDDSNISDVFFEIGSITKVMTSMIFSALVDEGVVELDDKIETIFSIDIEDKLVAGITLLQLSNHTSGLPRLPPDIQSPDLADPYATMDLDALMRSLSQVKLVSKSGEKFGYSNMGAALLAQAMMLKTGKSFNQLLDKYVFDPAGMDHSTSILAELDSIVVAQGIGWAGMPTSYWHFNAYEGAGAVYSNVREMARFVQKQFDPLPYMTSIRKASFDLGAGGSIGMGLFRSPREKNVFWHNGGTGGFRSCVAFSADDQIGVVVLSNVSAFHPQANKIDELCFKLLGLLQ